MKKPTHTVWTHNMGLRKQYSPVIERMIADRARKHVSPLGGTAVKAVPLAKGLRSKGP
jgi:hypothetical protein